MEKIYDHDYLMKVDNNENGWKIINQMREQAKACKSKYKLVLRGSKPKPNTKWGIRPSIPLCESQKIRIYIRPKQEEERIPSVQLSTYLRSQSKVLELEHKIRDFKKSLANLNLG